MNVTVQSVFGSPTVAWPIVRGLRQRIGDYTRVSLLVDGEQIEDHPPQQTSRAMSYAVIGATGGMFLGMLVAMVLPIAPEEMARDTLLSAALGALTGGLLGYFTGGIMLASLMTAEAKGLNNAIDHGAVVVRVEVPPAEADQVCEILAAAGGHRSDGTPGAERSDDSGMDRVIA